MKKILLALLCLPSIALAAQQEITAVPDSPVLPSIGALKDAINPKLLDIDENFDELYPAVSGKEAALGNPASDGYVLSSTAAGVRSWIEMTGGAGDDLGSAAYSDVVALWTTCTGYLKSDGTCDNPILDGTANGQMLIWATDDWIAATGLAFDNTKGDLTVPGALTAASFQTTAANGTVYAEAPNTTVMTAAATLGRLAFVDTGSGFANEKWRLADGTDWDEFLLDSRMIGQAGGVQGYDADLATWAGVTPGAGVATALGNGTNAASGLVALDSSSNATITGTLKARSGFNSYAVDTTLTAATHNSTIVQMTVAGEVTMWDCETANVGDTVLLWARDAEKIEVVPASGDAFALFDGTALTAGNELDIAATKGTKVTLMCTADDLWSVFAETSPSTDGGAAD